MNTSASPHPGVRVEIVFIDARRSQQIIAANTENQRAISRANLTKITDCIREGRFVLNGESIIISESGRLLNGQHRIHGVINSGTGIWTVLVTGVPDEYFSTIDGGKSRNFADILTINKDVNANNLASSVSRLAEYMQDASQLGSGYPFSNAELFAVREISPDLVDSVRLSLHLSSVIAPSRFAWLHYLAKDTCSHKLEEFMVGLKTGEMLPADSPIYLLRARLVANRSAKAKLKGRELFALLIKAWNAHLEGKALRVLRWSDGEKFPLVQFHTEPK